MSIVVAGGPHSATNTLTVDSLVALLNKLDLGMSLLQEMTRDGEMSLRKAWLSDRSEKSKRML